MIKPLVDAAAKDNVKTAVVISGINQEKAESLAAEDPAKKRPQSETGA